MCKTCQIIGRATPEKCENCKKPLTKARRVRVKPLTEKQKQYLNKIPRLTHRLIVKESLDVQFCPFVQATNDLQHCYCRVSKETASMELAVHCLSANFTHCPNFKNKKALAIYRKIHSLGVNGLTLAQDAEMYNRHERLGIFFELLTERECANLFGERDEPKNL